MSAPIEKFLLAAVCAAILIGGWLGYTALPVDFEPRPNHPGWEGRYQSLTAHLSGVERALFVQEQSEGGSHRFFRAQFVLLPVIVHRRADLDSVRPPQIEQTPLILDYYSRKGLREALHQLRTSATNAGFELEVERGRGHLALVRAKRGPR